MIVPAPESLTQLTCEELQALAVRLFNDHPDTMIKRPVATGASCGTDLHSASPNP